MDLEDDTHMEPTTVKLQEVVYLPVMFSINDYTSDFDTYNITKSIVSEVIDEIKDRL